MSDQDTSVARAVNLSLQLLEVMADANEDYTTSFNGLSMAAISLLIPFMQDNSIPVTPENVNEQFDRLMANMARAKDFVITNSPYLLKEHQNEQDQSLPG